MIWPDRFPFDVLDPDPTYCGNCTCQLADGTVLPTCQLIECDCHSEWLTETAEMVLRRMWGDK